MSARKSKKTKTFAASLVERVMRGRKSKKPKTFAENLVKLGRIDLALDLSSSGVREALVSLRSALEASDGSGTAQFRLDARDLNALYIYLPSRQLKLLVARLEALSL